MAEGSSALRVDVVSPERILFSGDARQVITRTLQGGEIAFLPGHAAFLGALTENHTRIYLTDGTIQDIAVHLGFVEVGPDHVSILSDSAELAQDINVKRAQDAMAKAQEQLRTEVTAEAESALRRATARLAASGNANTVSNH
ncbi:MAG: ATP synthase F1 subunit epsilon [Ilumatobacteraceae bacterium]|nr:ATP synthase F1 subunit epsilon [Ilumatobacteraceae bacterium]MBJ7486944.1 ATP synthase F1 subunit epsilon [Ilumatobacteraceae bacterium]